MIYAAVPPDVHVTGRRIVATLVDGFLFGCLSSLFTRVFGWERAESGFDLTRLDNSGSAALFVVVLLYYILLEGFTGRTLGKLVTGIRVVDAVTGDRPGPWAATVRTLLRLIDGLLGYLVGMIVVAGSARRRRLGDMAARTLVVRA